MHCVQYSSEGPAPEGGGRAWREGRRTGSNCPRPQVSERSAKTRASIFALRGSTKHSLWSAKTEYTTNFGFRDPPLDVAAAGFLPCHSHPHDLVPYSAPAPPKDPSPPPGPGGPQGRRARAGDTGRGGSPPERLGPPSPQVFPPHPHRSPGFLSFSLATLTRLEPAVGVCDDAAHGRGIVLGSRIEDAVPFLPEQHELDGPAVRVGLHDRQPAARPPPAFWLHHCGPRPIDRVRRGRDRNAIGHPRGPWLVESLKISEHFEPERLPSHLPPSCTSPGPRCDARTSRSSGRG